MESNSLFIQLAVVLGLSASLGYLVRLLKLPLLVAYLLAGVLLSLLQLFDPHSGALTFLPEVGIAFVLFLVGMELDFKEIKSLGKSIVFSSLTQITIAILAGFVIASFLGFSRGEAIYLGIALSFSSTIVVIKLLTEKRDLNSLYGKLSIGILLLEDLVAILLLMGITVGSSVFNTGLQSSLPILTLFAKGAILFVLALVLSRFVLMGVFRAVAKLPELLFLSALAWCFIFVAISILLGFSVVIGAFLAGVALANSPFHFEIQGKIKPLRDFFVTIFFVYLGSQIVFTDIPKVLPLIILFTLYALLIKPIIFLLILGALGFKKHTIFQTAINLSNISEFSLIVMVVGLQSGVVSQASLTAMTIIGVISIIVSSVMITYSNYFYRILMPFVGFFEHKNLAYQIEGENHEIKDHAIIVGGHLMGGEIVRFLKKEKVPIMIVDFNPRVIQSLVNDGFHAMYGDIGDPEVLEFLNLEQAKIIISTAPGVEDNLVLLTEAKRRKTPARVLLRANSAPDAQILYQAGADYVIMPEVVSGAFIAQTLNDHWPNLEYFNKRSEVELNKLAQNHFALE